MLLLLLCLPFCYPSHYTSNILQGKAVIQPKDISSPFASTTSQIPTQLILWLHAKWKKVKSLTPLFKPESRWDVLPWHMWNEAVSGQLPSLNDDEFPWCLEENLSPAISQSFALHQPTVLARCWPLQPKEWCWRHPLQLLSFWLRNSQASTANPKP